MKKNLPLSILSGLLLWIAWPPTPYTTFLLFIGFVPMLLAMENIIQSPSTKKGKQIFNGKVPRSAAVIKETAGRMDMNLIFSAALAIKNSKVSIL